MAEDPPAVPRKQVRPLSHWESAIDKQIREAQERGDFDNLPGRGRPLDANAWGQGEWALAHHVLRQAGETLPWISLSRDIEQSEDRLATMLRAVPHLSEAERPRARERFLQEAARLDKMLLDYSFVIPTRQLERGRLPRHIALGRFDAACRQQA
jgi:hypothetical protein